MKRKYAFIKIRSGHTVIQQLIQILNHAFPGLEMEVVNIKPLLLKKPYCIAINFFHMMRIYGMDRFLFSKRIFYNRFFGTPYMFQTISNVLKRELDNKDYLFSIQDNSLFNGNSYKYPHFVYTDYTVLANKRNPYFNPKSDMLSDKWIELEKTIYADALRVFTRTEDARTSVIQDYSCQADKVFTIYFAPFSSEEENIENTSGTGHDFYKNILFVGTEWERKGGPELIEAFTEVRKHIPDASLTIVGCNPLPSSPGIEIVGEIPRNEIHRYFSRASIFCLPTRWDSAAIVFIEAMRYGLPLVGTKVGAIPEYIKDGYNGYLIDTNNTPHLSKLLINLLSNQDKCIDMGLNSLDYYQNNFTMKKTSEHFRSLIEEVIAAK